MVRPIERTKAIQILRELGPMRYRDLLGDLSLGPWVPAYIRRSLRVFATDGDKPSLAVATEGSYGDTDCTEVHLVTMRPQDTLRLLDAVSARGELRLFVYDLDAATTVASSYRLRERVCQVNFHADQKAVAGSSTDAAHNVVQLTQKHEANVRSDPQMHHYWQVCVRGRREGFCCFAIMKDSEAVSFCVIGPDITGGIGFHTREILWICTLKAHRRQGLAKTLLTHASRYIVRGRSTAYYCTKAGNKASIATAKSAGYVEHGRMYSFRVSQRDLGSALPMARRPSAL